MEPIRIKIKDTEAAGIEIVPVEDGVEIIIRKDNKVLAPKEEPKKNLSKAPIYNKLEEFREFCGVLKKRHEGDKALIADLRRFWDFYSPKVKEWKGKTLDGEKLWARWCSTRQGSSVKYDK